MLNKEIDILKLIRLFWKERTTTIKVLGIALILGLVNHFLTPTHWKVTSELLPEVDEGLNIDPSLGGVAAIAGINLDQGGSQLNPELYSNITHSTPFLVELSNHKIYLSALEQEMRLIDFIEEHYRLTPIEWVFTVPKRVMSIFRGSSGNSVSLNNENSDFISLSKAEYDLLQILDKQLEVYVDKKSGTVIIKSKFQDRLAVAQINRFVVDYIKKYVTDYYRSKELQKLGFLKSQIKLRKAKYDSAQRVLDNYIDSNLILSSEKAKTELRKRQLNRDLEFNLYNSLLQKEQESELKVEEETPVFHIIEPYKVPSEKAAPRLKTTFLFSLVLGFIVSMVLTSFKLIFRSQQ